MSRFSICTYTRPETDGNEWKILSIFIFPFKFNDDNLDEAIAPFLSQEGPFDAVHFVGYGESVSIIEMLFGAESVAFDRMSNAIHDFVLHSRLISINQSNGELVCQTLAGEDVIDIALLAAEKRQSLQRLFINNNGLVNAANGVHYAKPSKTHSTQFLRTANVLESSASAFQIAFWIINYIAGRVIDRVVVDTSGIDSVAFVLGFMRLKMGLQLAIPAVESHSSYGGLEFLSVPNPETTLFLISATTSGSLHLDLVNLGAKSENIITLYYLEGKGYGPSNILCNLSHDSKLNRDGLNSIKSYPLNDCPYCKDHSYAIPMEGDQFTTEPARIAEIEILLSDFAEAHRKILDDLSSTGLFKVFRSVNSREFEIYLDVEAMLERPAKDFVRELIVKLERLLKRGIPVHLRRIIYTEYPGVEALAKVAFAFSKTELDPKGISITGSKGLGNHSKNPETASLIVSGCLDEVYELMRISRDLREIQPGGNTTYVAPLFRATSKRERKRIESNLTYGEYGPKTFNLYSVIEIELPACERLHSWQLEFTKLNELVHWADLKDIAVPSEIEQRIELLRSAPARGLDEKVFWPSPSGEELDLGSDFTMVPTDDGRRHLSQADIFVIASSLFHQYRQGINGKPRLMYKPYERTVISPESFQRFSDGVLQAAFLRAAREGEIGYANCEEQVSERMFLLMMDEVEAAKYGHGPVLMEYTIALMIGRLTLHPNHRSVFLDAIASEPLIPDWIRLCAQFMIFGTANNSI
jgi:hypothetical protein